PSRSRASILASIVAWSTTLLITHVILAAHRRIGTVRTDARVVRPRGELAPLDALDNVEQARPCVRQHTTLIVSAAHHRYELPFAAERHISRVVHTPCAFTTFSQPLLRAKRVHRNLQRPFGLRCITGLVVNDTKPSTGEEIDPVSNASQRYSAPVIGAK